MRAVHTCYSRLAPEKRIDYGIRDNAKQRNYGNEITNNNFRIDWDSIDTMNFHRRMFAVFTYLSVK